MKVLKNFLMIRLCLTALLMMCFAVAYSNVDTTTISQPGFESISDLFSHVNAVHGALVIILGYFSYLIPGIKNIQTTWVRVFAVGLLTLIGFLPASGVDSNVIKMLMGVFDVLASMGLYKFALKPMGLKSPKPQ